MSLAIEQAERYAAPMAFAVDGKEYLAITAGSAVYAFGLP
jgi:hypothetical protein